MGMKILCGICIKREKEEVIRSDKEFWVKVFHEFARQRGSKIIRGNTVQDHMHRLISIPPKYLISEVVG